MTDSGKINALAKPNINTVNMTEHHYVFTVKLPIKDTPKEDKPPNKGQAERTLVYTLYRKSLLKEDNLSTKNKMAGPESVLMKRFHCIFISTVEM